MVCEVYMLCKEQGLIAGYADGSFKPSNYANKAEALKMLLNTYGEELTEGIKINSIPYDDVVKSAWYAIYVWKASKLFNFRGKFR